MADLSGLIERLETTAEERTGWWLGRADDAGRLARDFDRLSAQVATLSGERDELKRERDEAQSTVTAWQQVFESIEAHLLDRINMRDEADPQRYLDIIRADVAQVIEASRRISASRWHDYRRDNTRAEAAEAANVRLREKIAEAGKVIEPFAKAAQETRKFNANRPLWAALDKLFGGGRTPLTVGDLRAAEAFLASLQAPAKQGETKMVDNYNGTNAYPDEV